MPVLVPAALPVDEGLLEEEEEDEEEPEGETFLLQTRWLGTLTPSALQIWWAYWMAVVWPALSHFCSRQQETPSMKSLFLHTQPISSGWQPAILLPDVYSVTQGFYRQREYTGQRRVTCEDGSEYGPKVP